MVDYMLSKDGRYLLRTYRKNQYQVALQGQVIETGLGFVITLDYNDLREILKRKRIKSNRYLHYNETYNQTIFNTNIHCLYWYFHHRMLWSLYS